MMPAVYRVEAFPESIIGTSLPVKVDVSPVSALHELDWVGVYPSSTPSLPGLSLSRWVYLGQGTINIKNDTATIEITVPVEKLPNYSGIFEVRLHSIVILLVIACTPNCCRNWHCCCSFQRSTLGTRLFGRPRSCFRA